MKLVEFTMVEFSVEVIVLCVGLAVCICIEIDPCCLDFLPLAPPPCFVPLAYNDVPFTVFFDCVFLNDTRMGKKVGKERNSYFHGSTGISLTLH